MDILMRHTFYTSHFCTMSPDYVTIMFPLSCLRIEGVNSWSWVISEDKHSFIIFTTIFSFAGGHLVPKVGRQVSYTSVKSELLANYAKAMSTIYTNI